MPPEDSSADRPAQYQRVHPHRIWLAGLLIAAFLAAHSFLVQGAGQQNESRPPSPPRLDKPTRPPATPVPVEPRTRAPKSALDAIALLAGANLASLPEQPVDPDPAVVLNAIAGAYAAVHVFDACDADDPWKVYDPSDPAGSNLTALDHKFGFWIDATQAVDLPSEGTLPDTTRIQLCTGWKTSSAT